MCTFPDNNTQKKKKNYESAHGEKRRAGIQEKVTERKKRERDGL